MMAAHGCQQLEARCAREGEVQDDEVDWPATNCIEGAFGGVGFDDPVALARENRRRDTARIGIVVDDEDRLRRAFGFWSVEPCQQTSDLPGARSSAATVTP